MNSPEISTQLAAVHQKTRILEKQLDKLQTQLLQFHRQYQRSVPFYSDRERALNDQ